jgi:NAD(P)-dependent dehydrogenase (short-subunit alcohol dehydrogenase family)
MTMDIFNKEFITKELASMRKHALMKPQNPSTATVIITGASSGIGEACALYLDKKGFTVFAGVRKPEDGLTLRQKASGRLTPLIVDVTDPESIDRARLTVAQTIASQNSALCLVNNAGVIIGGPLEFLSTDDLRKELEVNLVGVVQMTQAFLPMIRLSKGRIINMSSTSGLIAFPFLGPYAATKFALEAISDSWRIELMPWRISVSLVEPGDVATPLWDKSLTLIDRLIKQWPPQAFKLYGPIISMNGRFQKHGIPPEYVAKAVEHALSSSRPRTRYRVGQYRALVDLVRRLPIGLRDRLIASQLPRYDTS